MYWTPIQVKQFWASSSRPVTRKDRKNSRKEQISRRSRAIASVDEGRRWRTSTRCPNCNWPSSRLEKVRFKHEKEDGKSIEMMATGVKCDLLNKNSAWSEGRRERSVESAAKGACSLFTRADGTAGHDCERDEWTARPCKTRGQKFEL